MFIIFTAMCKIKHYYYNVIVVTWMKCHTNIVTPASFKAYLLVKESLL